MAEYVTFVGKTPAGDVIDVIVVTVFSSSGLRQQDTFGPAVEPEPPVMTLEAGEHHVWARADAYRFAWPLTITVNEGASTGPLLDQAYVVELVAEASSVPSLSQLPFRVYGYVRAPGDTAQPGGAVNRFATTIDDAYHRPLRHLQAEVEFVRVGPTYGGEVATFVRGERCRSGISSTGRFEVMLSSDTLYEVSTPGVAGVRYILTGDPGDEALLEELVQQSLQNPLDAILE